MTSTGSDGDATDNNGVFFVGGDLVDINSPKWQALSTQMLQAMLAERQGDEARPACGSGTGRGSYNTSIYVFALFLILFLSTLACAFPIIAKRFPGLSIPHSVLFISRHFGTGVLMATAFVHLLPTAFVSLNDPCLPYFWNKGYPAMPGAIAMTAVMLVVGIEMFFASRGARHVHGGDFEQLLGEEHEHLNGSAEGHRRKHTRDRSLKRFQRTSFERPPGLQLPGGHAEDESALLPNTSPVPVGDIPSPHPYPNVDPERDDPREVEDHQTVKPMEDSDDDLELDELDPMPVQSTSNTRNPSYTPLRPGKSRGQSDSPITPLTNGHIDSSLSAHQTQEKLLLQCMLLEAGILFHSIFIGMALSVSTGPPFYVFLLAISFHQTFEGLALGSRITAATAHFGPHSLRPWLMCLAFGATTPIGQALGLGLHNLYDPGSEIGLIVVGVTNAISSGLLLFAGLVELLAEDFLSDASYETLTGRRRLHACAAVVAGALLMALVGAWA